MSLFEHWEDERIQEACLQEGLRYIADALDSNSLYVVSVDEVFTGRDMAPYLVEFARGLADGKFKTWHLEAQRRISARTAR